MAKIVFMSEVKYIPTEIPHINYDFRSFPLK